MKIRTYSYNYKQLSATIYNYLQLSTSTYLQRPPQVRNTHLQHPSPLRVRLRHRQCFQPTNHLHHNRGGTDHQRQGFSERTTARTTRRAPLGGTLLLVARDLGPTTYQLNPRQPKIIELDLHTSTASRHPLQELILGVSSKLGLKHQQS